MSWEAPSNEDPPPKSEKTVPASSTGLDDPPTVSGEENSGDDKGGEEGPGDENLVKVEGGLKSKDKAQGAVSPTQV